MAAVGRCGGRGAACGDARADRRDLWDAPDLGARDLLTNRDDVRSALAARYTHVLVDEFQDTAPLQCEILWLLCGEGEADEEEEATFRSSLLSSRMAGEWNGKEREG